MKLGQIGGIASACALMFLAGPFGQLVDIINGDVKSWYLFGFTYIAFGAGVFTIIYFIRQYDNSNKETIRPKVVFVPCAVFLMIYLMASAFR